LWYPIIVALITLVFLGETKDRDIMVNYE